MLRSTLQVLFFSFLLPTISSATVIDVTFNGLGQYFILHTTENGFAISAFERNGNTTNFFGGKSKLEFPLPIEPTEISITPNGDILASGLYYESVEGGTAMRLGLFRITPRGEQSAQSMHVSFDEAAELKSQLTAINDPIIDMMVNSTPLPINTVIDKAGAVYILGEFDAPYFSEETLKILKIKANGRIDISFGKNGFYSLGSASLFEKERVIGASITSLDDGNIGVVLSTDQSAVSSSGELTGMVISGKGELIRKGTYQFSRQPRTGFITGIVNPNGQQWTIFQPIVDIDGETTDIVKACLEDKCTLPSLRRNIGLSPEFPNMISWNSNKTLTFIAEMPGGDTYELAFVEIDGDGNIIENIGFKGTDFGPNMPCRKIFSRIITRK